MKKLLLTTLMAFLSVFSITAANQNIANLITSSDWDAIFPNRAQAGHPQGATDDFYSYARFSSAVDKLSEYSVTFSPGPNNQGTSVAVSKTDGTSYTYVITSSSWAGADYTVDYSTFCNTGDDNNDKRELAAFLANITKETTGGWGTDVGTGSAGDHGKWGLYWLRELGPGGSATAKSTNCYTTGSTIDYQPAPGKCYYGRGPIQISYFYNYGNFSEFLYNNTSLVSNPDVLETDGELALMSAIWFWMTPQCPKPSCHQVMQEIYDESATSYSSALMGKKGFLHTVNIINGDVECRGGNAKPLLRSKLYKYYMGLIGFTQTEVNNEDLGEYRTVCNSGGTMVKYTSCDFQNVVVNNCSAPVLGNDVELSGGTASLNANITLQSGETIAWYKDNVLINGATSTTYTATEAGTYKAVVTGTDCTKEDIIIVSAEVFICSQPALGSNVELSGGTATLNANVTLASGETIAWYKNGNLIGSATSTTYTATETGTYKAVVTGTGCSNEDEIIVSAEVFICSEPDLGADKELVSGSTVLDANITLQSGETIAWYKDNVLINGATNTTYTATSDGTYKAVTTRPGCTGEDDIIIYNEGEGPTCSKPALADTVELIGGSVTLDPNITLQVGETVAWYKDGTQIWNASGTTHTVNQTGTYKIVVTGPDCTEEDEVVVAIICSTPDLGSDKGFDGVSTLLDAGITLKTGETITWYKDGAQQWGINTTTFTATALGTYKVVISNGSSCSSEDEVIVAETTCSTPDLGGDIRLCAGTSATLDANVVLEPGESLKWYKDNVEIGGATATTYTATVPGTYKAEVTTTDCLRSDEIVVADGGAQTLQLNASNNGEFCVSSLPNQVALTVTGGGGDYNFYDVPTGGTPIGTGASFTVDDNLVDDGDTKTFYAQETSGPPVTLVTEAYTQSAWTNFASNLGWNDHRIVFNTLDDVTLESIDFVFGYKNTGPYDITVTIYEYGTNNVVETKVVTLNSNNLTYSNGSNAPLNTAELGIELPAGNYEMSLIGSTFVIQVSTSGLDYTHSSYSSTGVAEILGVNQPFQPGTYPTAIQTTHVGAYNWVFKSGGGSCGRAAVDVTANCGITTDIKEVIADAITVYPNPASDVVNINLGNINAQNTSIELYNSVGQLVKSQNINSVTGNVTQLQTNDINGGLYFVKVLAEGKVYTTSVVINK
jgi:hypothetical protein